MDSLSTLARREFVRRQSGGRLLLSRLLALLIVVKVKVEGEAAETRAT